jgi:HSP20 family molecular chaperone IbpA
MKLYQRRLRDYAAEFDELKRRRIAMLTDKDAIEKDIVRLKQAEDAATKIQAFRTDERTKLTSDLAGLEKERTAIERHLA